MTLSGIIAATVTPLNRDGTALAPERVFAGYFRFLIERGVHGLFVCGTTGEGPLLAIDERKRVVELAIRHVGRRVPVIAHAGATTTAASIDLARHALDTGADGIAVVTPSYYPLDEETLFRYFKTVADAAAGLPVFLYNIPAFAGNAITPALVGRLRGACANVAGMKHSDANLVRLQEFQTAGGPGFAVLSGSDAVAAAALELGAQGCVSGNAAVLPEVVLAVHDAVRRGDLAAARRHQEVLHEIRALLGDGLRLSWFKAALRRRGIEAGGVRAPLPALEPEDETRIADGLAALRRAGHIGDPLVVA